MPRGKIQPDGKEVCLLRSNKGWEQRDLANRTGLSLRTINNVECGHPVKVSTLRIIADKLGVGLDQIMIAPEIPTPDAPSISHRDRLHPEMEEVGEDDLDLEPSHSNIDTPDSHCAKIVHILSSLLADLKGNTLTQVESRLYPLVSGTKSSAGPPSKRIIDLATFLVDRCFIDEAMGVLVSLLDSLEVSERKILAQCCDVLLPVNYDRSLIQQLCQHLSNGVAIIEGCVATETLAEVIAAGAQNKPALFRSNGWGATAMGGGSAEGAPVGPEEQALPRATLEMLRCLLQWKDVDLLYTDSTNSPGERNFILSSTAGTGVPQAAALSEAIQGAARRLRGSLSTHRKKHEGRAIYCVVRLPQETTPPNPVRAFALQVLQKVHSLVGEGFFFVELIPDSQASEREFEMAEWIRMRLVALRSPTP